MIPRPEYFGMEHIPILVFFFLDETQVTSDQVLEGGENGRFSV